MFPSNSGWAPWATVSSIGLAWLLTFAIHSTLLIGLAWLVTRRIRSHHLRDVLWKAALIGGILTTTLQLVLPSAGRLKLPSISLPSIWTSQQAAEENLPQASSTSSLTDPDNSSLDERVFTWPSRSSKETVTGSTDTGDKRRNASKSLSPWVQIWVDIAATSWDHRQLFGFWLAAAILATLRLLFFKWLLLTQLKHRHPITQGPLVDALAQLCRSNGIRHPIKLSWSPYISSPVALSHKEICLPEQSVSQSGPEQQRCLLAHELAHVARHDPFWLVCSGILVNVFFFQPLYRLARRSMRACAECLADDRAARYTGNGLALAKCLVEVARWPSLRFSQTVVHGMAQDHRVLEYRVRRLLDGSWAARVEKVKWWWIAGIAITLAVVGAVAPGVAAEVKASVPTIESAKAPDPSSHILEQAAAQPKATARAETTSEEITPTTEPTEAESVGTSSAVITGTTAMTGISTTTPISQAVTHPAWEMILQRHIEHESKLAGFLNEVTGITFDPTSQARYTTDSGLTWTAPEDAPPDLGEVDSEMAWYLAGDPEPTASDEQIAAIYSTYVEEPRASGRANTSLVAFADAQVGWGVFNNSGFLLATTDGGETWTEKIPIPRESGPIAALALRSAQEGYVLDGTGQLYVTLDGGASWSIYSLDLQGPMQFSLHCAAMHFSDAERGLIVLTLLDGETFLLRTADGGQTWQQESLPIVADRLYLSRDGTLLTALNTASQQITLLRLAVP